MRGIDSKDIDESIDQRRRNLFWVGRLMNGARTLKEGYNMFPDMGMIEPISIRTRVNRLAEIEVEKDATETTGKQEQAPGAGFTGHTVGELKGVEVRSPKPVKQASEKFAKVEISGEVSAEPSTEANENESTGKGDQTSSEVAKE